MFRIMFNPLESTPMRPTFSILLCLTPDYFILSNARRFYSSSG